MSDNSENPYELESLPADSAASEARRPLFNSMLETVFGGLLLTVSIYGFLAARQQGQFGPSAYLLTAGIGMFHLLSGLLHFGGRRRWGCATQVAAAILWGVFWFLLQ